MKVRDVRLRGCGFTLFPAVKEEGVEGELMHLILSTIYRKLGIINEDGMSTKESDEIEKKDPDMIVKFEVSDFGNKLSELKEAGLIDYKGNLTEKSIKILEKAADKQKELDKENFSYCPCRCHC